MTQFASKKCYEHKPWDNYKPKNHMSKTSETNEPKPEKKTADAGDKLTVQEAIVKLEELYSKKEAELTTASVAFVEAQTKLAQCEHETLVILRQLMPLQNRYLMAVIEKQNNNLKLESEDTETIPK